MSRRQYRRNGTPIGKYRVYALVFKRGEWTQSYEIMPSGIENYEDLEGLVELEAMTGKFGYGYDRLVITKPGVLLIEQDMHGVDIRGADLSRSNLTKSGLMGAKFAGASLRGADLSGSFLSGSDFRECELSDAILRGADLFAADLTGCYYPRGKVPPGWVRFTNGTLRRR